MTGFYENYDDAEGVHKGSAEQSALEAAASATAAASSATSAETSATSSSTKAGEAATSASTATTKASEAATSASTATTKASESATSAAASDTSATESATSATASESSRQASASAAAVAVSAYGSAFNSATASAASATAAAGSESAVAASATAAAGSATTASTSASNAATSESNAATSATEAAASATLANSAEVVTVAGIAADVTAVAGIDGNVTSVAGIASDVTTVAAEPLKTNIATVAATPLSTNINIVGPAASSVTTVAGDIAKVNTVASDLSGSDTIGTVAGIATDVTTVSGISADVTTVAGITAGDISLVAAVDDKVTQVAAINNEVSVVGSEPYKTKVETVAESVYKGKVETVSGLTSEVTAVANIASDVTTVSDNITDVQNAEENATIATNKAAESAASAVTSAASASTSASSAAASASSATAAASSESNAATSESDAAVSASSATVSAASAQSSKEAAAVSETNAAASYDSFDDRYLGVKSSAPSTDNDGGALLTGALYFNSTNNTMNVFTGSAWAPVANNNIINPNVALTQDLATNGNDVKFGDNDKATFGAGDDLQIYHDGGNSYISEVGAGDLVLKASSNLVMRGNTSNDILAVFSDGGASNLYYDNSPKLATTSTGIDVTGTATMDGLVISGGSLAAGGNNEFSFVGKLAAGRLVSDAGTSNIASINSTYNDDVLELTAGASNNFVSGIVIAGQSTTADSGEGVKIFRRSVPALGIDGNGDISFYEDTGTTPKLFWDASAESLGIGTSSIDYQASNRTVVHIEGSAGALLAMEDTGAKSYLFQTGNDLLIENDTSAGSIIFGTNASTERMRIDSSGNVGIGTSSPNVSGFNTALTVDGAESGIELTEGGTVQGIVSSNSKGLGLSGIGSRGIRLFTSASGAATERMRIDSSGNVGIGTSSPAYPLEVRTSSDTEISAIRTGSVRASLGAFASGESRLTSAGGSSFQTFYTGTSSTERMRIDSTGRVGIGTSSPDTLMEIASTSPVLRITNTTDAAWSAGQDIGRLSFYSTDASAVGPHETAFILNESDFGSGVTQLSGALSFGTAAYNAAATERMRIDSSGLVSIKNVAAPTLRLENTDLSLSAGQVVGALEFFSSDPSGKGPNVTGYIETRAADSVGAGGEMVFATGAIGSSPEGERAIERMRIDSSGNMLVGKTAASSATVGFQAGQDGFTAITRASGQPLVLNRTTTDGIIADFRKDGTTVGSIGSVAGGYTMYNSESGTGYLGVNGAATYAWDATKVYHNTDATGDLGLSNRRFKDAYLSGGVYLGGTGAANKLDDYEEGTFTTTVYAADGTTVLTLGTDYALRTAAYTKIGQLVRLSIRIEDLRATKDNLWFTVPFASIDNDAVVGSILPSAQLTPSSYGTASIYATYTKFRLTKGNYRYPYGSCSYRTNS